MKKYMLLALSALALASCSNDEVVVNNPANAISFSVTAPKGSRANDKFNGKFKVYAYQAGTEGAYINGAFYNTANANNPWTVKDGENPESNVNFYWPVTTAETTLTFNAVAPETVAAFNGKAITSYTASGSEDLCYAVTVGAQKPTTVTDAKTRLNFYHALSKVTFALKNTQPGDLEIKVSKVEITNINSVGNLPLRTDFSTEAFNDNYAGAKFSTWESLESPIAYTVGTNAGGLLLTEGGVSVGTGLFLLPQDITAWDKTPDNNGTRVVVTCIVKSLANSQEIWNGKVNIPLTSIKWEQSKTYNYTLAFGNGAGYDDNGNPVLVKVDINATVDDFVTGGNFEVAPNL